MKYDANTTVPVGHDQLADSAGSETPRLRKVIIVYKTHYDIGYTSTAHAVVHEYRTRMADDLRERCDEDFWRNPRTPEALAGRLAAGQAGPETERPPLAFAAEALVRRLEGV